MRFIKTVALAGAAAAAENYSVPVPQFPASAVPLGVPLPSLNGFEGGAVFPARGGRAICIKGTIPVQAQTAMNLKFNYEIPQNQSQLTQTFLNMVTPGSPFMEEIKGGMQSVNGTYNIFGNLCLPSGDAKPKAVQIATHGVGFNHVYWDIGPGTSYIDVATKAGYAVFSYDRLGVGYSAKPDGLNVVQAPLELAIAEELVKKLRAGDLGDLKFEKVIAVGHSFGSIISEAITANAPTSLDAAILTGFSMNMTGLAAFTLGLNFGIASQVSNLRFSDLSNSYIIPRDASALHAGFLRAPGFNPEVAQIAVSTDDTATLGELFSQAAITKPATNFTGPVAIVNGDADLPFCFGNCTYPVNKAEEPLKKLYPSANATAAYLAKDAGHGLNYHYSALDSFNWIQQFLLSNGINP